MVEKIIYKKKNGSWDGKINNNPAQIGVYLYSIISYDFKNKPFKFTGSFSLTK